MSRLAELAELAYMAQHGSPWAWLDMVPELNPVDREIFFALDHGLCEDAIQVIVNMG